MTVVVGRRLAAAWVACLGAVASAQEPSPPPAAPSTATETSDPQREDAGLRRYRESVVITAARLDPRIDRRTDAVFKDTLFSRDDQVFHTLAAGINAGQHEGGGKSLEIRRFGFNLDHGGVSGGLKVLIDNVQQNQGTQGHGQGYLGSLKSVSPELVDEVEIVNGPFSARYGDFSGLGVVHFRLKESLADPLSVRMQAGSFGSLRGFAAASRRSESSEGLLAYEGSRSDGPFINPLGYARDNITASYTRRAGASRAFGVRFNAGRNDFVSSGQIPLDEVSAGRLDRFGFIDPDNGGRARAGTVAGYYREILPSGDVLKLNAFVSRSLLDLYSNFTFFLANQVEGDEIQQHDSRLQEGFDGQYLHANRIFGRSGLLAFGTNVHGNQIRVGLAPTIARAPTGVSSLAHADLWNAAVYAEQSVDLGARLRLEGGARLDAFRFDLRDLLAGGPSRAAWAVPVQPKASLTWRASGGWRLHANYGRGIASQDARGIARDPAGPRVSTTDFYQLGVSREVSGLGISANAFWIDRSNEQVYVPDDGSVEFKGPSRAYGVEAKASARLLPVLSITAGLTHVFDAFYRSTSPRVIVAGAPRIVGDVALTLSRWQGLSGSLRYRHAGGYRLDGDDPTVGAAGLDVLDLALHLQLHPGLGLSLSMDNVTGKRYYETQNYFESRLRPGDPVVPRIHATPGFPRAVTLGLVLTPFSR